MHGLYAISPETHDSARLVEQVGKAIAGGASAVQYRCKRLGHDLARKQAEELRTITRATGTLFIVNDNSELAFAVGADGLHIGRDDGDLHTISRIRDRRAKHYAGTEAAPFVIGVSCYNELERAATAVAAGADYIAFGSFFPSATKPEAVKAELALIPAAKARFDVPIVAIGGITVYNARQLIAAKADAVAVITALFETDDIELRAREFTDLFKSGKHVRK